MGEANKGAASDTDTTSIPSDVGSGDKGDEIWRESVVPGTDDDQIRGEGVDDQTDRLGSERRQEAIPTESRLAADRQPVLSQPPRGASTKAPFVTADPATEAAARSRGGKD